MLLAQLSDACGDDPRLICEAVYEWTDSEWAARLLDWLVERPLRIALIVLAAYVISRLARRAVGRLVERIVVGDDDEEVITADPGHPGQDHVVRRPLLARRRRNERAQQRAVTITAVLRGLIRAVVWSIAGLLILGEVDINLAPLIAGAGVVGLAIGFGAQSLVRDFLAGIFILFEDQYGVGDVVDVGEASGLVESVSMRATRLRDVEGVLWVVPNGEIRRVGNKSQLWARTVLDIDVAYDTDIEHASTVIKAVADEMWRAKLEDATIIEEPEVWGVENFGPDAISIRLAVKTDPSEQWVTARHLRGKLKEAFDREGIEIPFPQRTVWVRSGADVTS